MSRWVLLLVLTVATATASAQPAQPAAVTARAQTTTRAIEGRLAQVTTRWNALAKRYADQTAAIDRLKQQRTSWRQQRELAQRLADANDTAIELTKVTAERAQLTGRLVASRRSLLAAIDAELAAGAAAPRATQLTHLRGQLAPQLKKKRVARIVLPEMEIDPLADPEELEQQAVALREAEAQLLNQIVGLEKQERELDAIAKLRKQHDRAGDLARRDDDQPQRTAQRGGAGRGGFESAPTGAAGDSNDGASPPPEGSPGGSGGGGGGAGTGTGQLTGGGGFESEASIVLADVVDASTIESLARAQRTGDPAQRAAAAKKTRDAVARRLAELKRKRAEIESLLRPRKR